MEQGRNTNWLEEQPIMYFDTLLQYYLHIPDPGALSDEEWISKINILGQIRKKETSA